MIYFSFFFLSFIAIRKLAKMEVFLCRVIVLLENLANSKVNHAKHTREFFLFLTLITFFHEFHARFHVLKCEKSANAYQKINFYKIFKNPLSFEKKLLTCINV